MELSGTREAREASRAMAHDLDTWAFPPTGPCDVANTVRCELPEGTTVLNRDAAFLRLEARLSLIGDIVIHTLGCRSRVSRPCYQRCARNEGVF